MASDCDFISDGNELFDFTKEIPGKATEVPAAEVPATEASTSEIPATEVPATDVSATANSAKRNWFTLNPPATKVPATQVPAAGAPATKVPANDFCVASVTYSASLSIMHPPLVCNLLRVLLTRKTVRTFTFASVFVPPGSSHLPAGDPNDSRFRPPPTRQSSYFPNPR